MEPYYGFTLSGDGRYLLDDFTVTHNTMALCGIAAHALQYGGRVLYYSLEMGETDIVDRIDANISKVPMAQLRERADFVREAVEEWYDSNGGALVVKQLPSYQTTSQTIERHMKQIRAENKFKPTLLIVDSGDFMSASDGHRERHDLELGSVYSELRGLAVSWGVPCWTASWARREALAKEIVTMGDVAESWRKVGISDIGVAICGTEEEFQSGVLRLYVAWCRFAAGGFVLGPYHSGFRQGCFIDNEKAPEDVI
jgi:hypothetical protein